MTQYLKIYQNRSQYENDENKGVYNHIIDEVEIINYVPPRPTQIITYNASAKLVETTDTWSSGLHTNAFNTTIKSHTFENGVGTIEFNDDVTSIGDNAFYGCTRLTSIDIPNSVTSIGNNAFRDCYSLTSIDIPNSVTSIGNTAFTGCNHLTSCTIGSGVTTIDTDAFYGCTRLTSIDIPNSVTSIGQNAFGSCNILSSVTIGSGVTSIGNSAFKGCGLLTSVTVQATTPPTLGTNAFYDTAYYKKIYVPSASVNIYKSASGWKTYANYIEAIPSV